LHNTEYSEVVQKMLIDEKQHTLNYNQSHSYPLSVFRWIPLFSTLFLFKPLYFSLIHSNPLYSTLLHSIALYCTLLHSIALYCTLFHSIPLYSIIQHINAWLSQKKIRHFPRVLIEGNQVNFYFHVYEKKMTIFWRWFNQIFVECA